jgi:hypothetical protein
VIILKWILIGVDSARDRNQWAATVNVVIKVQIPLTGREFLGHPSNYEV